MGALGAVRQRVPVEVGEAGEGGGTLRTLVGALFRVQQLVARQGGRGAVAFATVGAALPAGVVLRAAVRGAGRQRGEGLGALAALVEALCGVRVPVAHQRLAVHEALAALRALEGALAGVCAPVRLQLGGEAVALPAVGTRVRQGRAYRGRCLSLLTARPVRVSQLLVLPPWRLLLVGEWALRTRPRRRGLICSHTTQPDTRH